MSKIEVDAVSKVFGDDLGAVADLDRDRRHPPAFLQKAARRCHDQHFGAALGLFLDRCLDPAERDELLLGHQRDDVHRTLRLGRTARGETKGDAGLRRLVHDDKIDAHDQASRMRGLVTGVIVAPLFIAWQEKGRDPP